MIDFLEGKVRYKGSGYIVVQSGSIGYKIYMSLSSLSKIDITDKDLLIYTYLLVKERDISLFGFLKKQERGLFISMLGVNGIGAKTALATLSLFSPEKFEEIIMNEGVDELKKVPGIGKKTAQRMILELKGTLEKGLQDREEEPEIKELYLALSTLGYSKGEARKIIEGLEGKLSSGMSINEMLTVVLKNLDRKK